MDDRLLDRAGVFSANTTLVLGGSALLALTSQFFGNVPVGDEVIIVKVIHFTISTILVFSFFSLIYLVCSEVFRIESQVFSAISYWLTIFSLLLSSTGCMIYLIAEVFLT